MDSTIPPTRSDVVVVPSEPRPTPSKAKFSEVLAAGATSVVQGAEAAMTVLPGSPLTALAVRGPMPGPLPGPPLGPGIPAPPLGGGLPMSPMGPGLTAPGAAGGGAAAEGPGGLTASPGAAMGTAMLAGLAGDGGLQATMIQSQQMNMYYLQVQQQVDAENRNFTTLSNVLKTENDTVKNAIGNIH
jgi:hypothetical protein